MSDIRYKEEYCIVRQNGTDEMIINGLISGRVETMQQIEKHSTLKTIPIGILPALPETGQVEAQVYAFEGKAVQCVQPHIRTIYPPIQTPALFSFFRENTDELEWITNEKVEVGWVRTYDTIKYVVKQPHMTQQAWNPELTLGVLWSLVVVNDYANAPQWVTANWGQYVLGFAVKDSGKIWKVKGVTHTWIQPALTGNGAISWEYVQDDV